MKKLKSNLIKHTPETRLYQIPVPIIGLTGGIASGKSTIADFFKKENIPVIDADRLVKNIYQTIETKNFIRTNFPQAIEGNEINFKKLRELVFQDPLSKTSLENQIYQYLPSEFKKAFTSLNNPLFIVYDVPLLFEKKLDPFIDLSICVYAPRKMQIERLIIRDHSTQEMAEKIIDQQIDIEEKKKHANFVIENTSNLNELEVLFKRLLQEITY